MSRAIAQHSISSLSFALMEHAQVTEALTSTTTTVRALLPWFVWGHGRRSSYIGVCCWWCRPGPDRSGMPRSLLPKATFLAIRAGHVFCWADVRFVVADRRVLMPKAAFGHAVGKLLRSCLLDIKSCSRVYLFKTQAVLFEARVPQAHVSISVTSEPWRACMLACSDRPKAR